MTLTLASTQDNSLLLWQGDHRTGHYFAIAIRNGFLEFRYLFYIFNLAEAEDPSGATGCTKQWNENQNLFYTSVFSIYEI